MNGGRSVLLVDGEEATRFAVSRLLGRAGHRVTAVADAAAADRALAAMPDGEPAAAVLDGGEFGQTAATVIGLLERRAQPRPLVVLVGTRQNPMEAAKVRAIGADAYLVKPFLAAELEAAIAARPAPTPGSEAAGGGTTP